jgi:predicted transcriptional regulator
MGELITLEDWVTIRNLHAKGFGKKTIAKMLGISKNTVKSALKKDSPPKYQRNVTFENKLIAPYAEKIDNMYLQQELIGTRIFKEISKIGYQGSMTTLYRYLNSLGKDGVVGGSRTIESVLFLCHSYNY